MRDKTAFWDSSALVPLCCGDRHSVESGRFSMHFPKMIVWWSTRVEIRSALRRLLRERELAEEGYARASELAGQLRIRWSEILPADALRDIAEQSLDQYQIRAADALQLAAALVWCS